MKLYVKATSSYRSDLEDIVIKKELKLKYKVDTRRKDDFIYAGLLGALRLRDTIEIHEDDALYLTSGVGNFNIISTVYEDMITKKELMRLFDFINILGNTTSFYVAKTLGIKAKSLFQISDNFTYFHSLINIYASLKGSSNEAILGAIDIKSEDENIIKRLLDVEKDVSCVSSVSYQKLSLERTDALVEIEFDTMFYTLEEVQKIIQKESMKVICSLRCSDLKCDAPIEFFENLGANVVADVVEMQEDTLFIESYDNKYKILKIRALK
ncbi:hypothetical protein MNB_SM-4-1788 [hydrothermal vent metagenome]|uniref:Uncharacterized protein n=1 Tax=hydrothermal vent metagenome TaxID=652676 RepID=A0A1W1C9I9_9ZZZZ